MKRMSDEQLSRAHERQKNFALTGSALGLTGLGLLGGSYASKKAPVAASKAHLSAERSEKLRRWGQNTSITAGGVGAISGINFARIQDEESKRAAIKKRNYGDGYQGYYQNTYDDESGLTIKRKVDRNTPFAISRKAADPERSRQRRAAAYPVLMAAGSGGAGVLAVKAATEKAPKASTPVELHRFNGAKGVKTAAATAAAGGLGYGAYYNSRKKNRVSYGDNWYLG